MRHRTTDPRCWHFQMPHSTLGRWWFNRQRGKTCKLCSRPLREQVAPKPRWTCLDCRHANREVGHAGCSGWPCACPCRHLRDERDDSAS